MRGRAVAVRDPRTPARLQRHQATRAARGIVLAASVDAVIVAAGFDATSEAGEPDHSGAGDSPNETVWYSLTPGTSQQLRIDVNVTDLDEDDLDGDLVEGMERGTGPGNFSWLTWDGDVEAPR